MARVAWIGHDHPKYRWVALSNTTLGVLISTINASIVLISLPAIFQGIQLNPLEPANVSYLLWMIMGYLLVTAVFVVMFGRLGDQYGRVRVYNLGFVVFTVAAIALSLDFLTGPAAAAWLIVWRCIQGIGGAMLTANSTAILTDAFPPNKRGFSLGLNQVAALAGTFLGLIIGGVLATWDWRAVFIVSVPFGIFGTIWSYLSLHEVGTTSRGRVDWAGNTTFAVGLTALLIGVTYGIQPYESDSQGWRNPWVLAALFGGALVLVLFVVLERRVKDPMIDLSLFAIRPLAAGLFAGLLAAISRGGMQFVLIIWLQGIWLPLHGYSFESTPFWAGIYMVPITIGFLVSGPVAGALADRWGPRWIAASGLFLVAATFIALTLIPVQFDYWVFAVITGLNGIGSGMFSSPNRTAIMNSVPVTERGAASGLAGVALNAGSAVSIGVFFSLMSVGLAVALPGALHAGLTANGVPEAVSAELSQLPPVGSLFATMLGYNPLGTMLPAAVLHAPGVNAAALTGQELFPNLIAEPFRLGLVVVFIAAAIMAFIGAIGALIGGNGRAEVRVITGPTASMNTGATRVMGAGAPTQPSETG